MGVSRWALGNCGALHPPDARRPTTDACLYGLGFGSSVLYVAQMAVPRSPIRTSISPAWQSRFSLWTQSVTSHEATAEGWGARFS